jgi:hypothetical protein
MRYKGLDALKPKTDDPLIRSWADTLKPKSRTKLFVFLQFWEWARKHSVEDPKTGEEMLADYDRCHTSGKPELEFRHLRNAKEFVKNKGTSPSDRQITMSAIRAFYGSNLRPLQELDSELNMHNMVNGIRVRRLQRATATLRSSSQ